MTALGLSALLVAACGSDEPSSMSTERRLVPKAPSATPASTAPATTASQSAKTPEADPPRTNPPQTGSSVAPPPSADVVDCATRLVQDCRSADVRALQELLTAAGFGSLEPDGIFGPATQAALDGFEAACDECRVDGVIEVGGAEWAALKATDPVAGSTPWPTVFNSWTGGGDIPNSCSEVGGRVTVPVGPEVFFGAFDVDGGNATLHVGLRYEMCIFGFDPRDPITLTVSGPLGTHTTTVLSGASADASLIDVIAAGGPDAVTFQDLSFESIDGPVNLVGSINVRLDEPTLPGEYILDASQGTTTATRVVRVEAGDFGDPQVRVIAPSDFGAWFQATPGDALRAVLVGFPPNSTIPMAIYGGTERFREYGEPLAETGDGFDFEFVQELPSATVGGQGWAYYDFDVPDLPANPDVLWDYCLVTIESLRELYCQPGNDAVFNMAS